MEDDLKKNEMEDDLNFKAVLLSLFNNKNLKKEWFWHHRDWPSFWLTSAKIDGQYTNTQTTLLSLRVLQEQISEKYSYHTVISAHCINHTIINVVLSHGLWKRHSIPRPG